MCALPPDSKTSTPEKVTWTPVSRLYSAGLLSQLTGLLRTCPEANHYIGYFGRGTHQVQAGRVATCATSNRTLGAALLANPDEHQVRLHSVPPVGKTHSIRFSSGRKRVDAPFSQKNAYAMPRANGSCSFFAMHAAKRTARTC